MPSLSHIPQISLSDIPCFSFKANAAAHGSRLRPADNRDAATTASLISFLFPLIILFPPLGRLS